MGGVRRYILFVTLLIGLILGKTVLAAAIPSAQSDYVPGEVLVRWKNDPSQRVSLVQVDNVAEAVRTLRLDQRVAWAEPNYKRYLSVIPDDPEYAGQVYLEQSSDHDIDAEAAWDTTTGTRSVIIAVIDSGTDIDHPDLIDNIWTNPNEIADNGIDDDANGYIDDVHGWDFIENDNDPSPTPTGLTYNEIYVLHGTHVAGIIGASGNNTTGVTGVNWKVSIMPLRIFDDDGESTADAELNAIAYAEANGAFVMNMSYGGYSYSLFEDQAIQDAYAAGVLSVAAAGNDTIDLDLIPSYPVCYDHVLGVGAVDSNDATSFFTNYGNTCVDLSAPGENILSTHYYDPTNGFTDYYGYLSGTSMATPVVTGVAALLWATNAISNSLATLAPSDVASTLINSTDAISDTELGSGRVNAAAVVDTVFSPGPDAVAITAYTNSHESQTIGDDKRTNDATPYFVWDEPTSVQAAVNGYYVYFGTDRVDPVTDGTLQTGTTITPTVSAGNEVTYHLRIKAVDTLGQTSDLTDFKYVIDTKLARPVWRSVRRTAAGVQLRWYRPKGEYVVGYYVYRSHQRFGVYKRITPSLIIKRSYLDKKVQRQTHYYYKVRAYDDLDNHSILTARRRA